MKSIITICALTCVIALETSAQKITVTTGSENLGGGSNPAFQVFIPYTTVKTVEKKWHSFLKDYHAKVKSSKDEITGQNFMLKKMDTLQVYSRISENKEGIMLSAAFASGGAFVTPGTLQTEYDMLTRMLHEFALPIAKDGLDKKTEDASDLLKEKSKDYDKLVKRNEHLQESNKKMKAEISDNEREISDNEGKIGGLKNVVEQQKKQVDDIKSKSKDLE